MLYIDMVLKLNCIYNIKNKNKLSNNYKKYEKMCWQLRGTMLILTQQQNTTTYKSKQENPKYIRCNFTSDEKANKKQIIDR